MNKKLYAINRICKLQFHNNNMYGLSILLIKLREMNKIIDTDNELLLHLTIYKVVRYLNKLKSQFKPLA